MASARGTQLARPFVLLHRLCHVYGATVADLEGEAVAEAPVRAAAIALLLQAAP